MKTKGNKIIKKYGIAVLSIILTALYPCLYMYFNNILETHLIRIFLPLGVFCFLGILFFALVQRVYHNPDKSAFVSCVYLFMFTNYMIIYKLFESKIDGFKYIHMTIIFAVILGGNMYVFRKVSMDNTPTQIISFVLAGLIAFNGISCIPDVLSSKKEVEALEVTQEGDASDFNGNVYYFILDEYGGKENLEYFFDFDNEEFLSELRTKIGRAHV